MRWHKTKYSPSRRIRTGLENIWRADVLVRCDALKTAVGTTALQKIRNLQNAE